MNCLPSFAFKFNLRRYTVAARRNAAAAAASSSQAEQQIAALTARAKEVGPGRYNLLSRTALKPPIHPLYTPIYPLCTPYTSPIHPCTTLYTSIHPLYNPGTHFIDTLSEPLFLDFNEKLWRGKQNLPGR
jgi:hypothetical protein